MFYFDKKSNTLYINSDIILPNTKGMSFREHCKAFDEAFKLSYEERIEKFATKEQKEKIRKALEEHKGCNISEYSNVCI